ncbi:Protein involved in biosynthesis of mitomycin antibiotics/polyketide fumonisin [Kibdelosporangium sp. 4NS15]|uniref:Protein involved in biosynthesis of mitomycin antibiotics/polyketide fumonisin n=1 Tax=Kibdelosporangium persicum TaxID=2698649 RepID=A0ABX2F6H2_9PSEU|nr:phytanoyl-CoA dioxygenase family protein [Kibdelosporangium persicum]NRN66390.1 Protein involved in biosynthesis of mitomycin antibiotics/polyketide fumonisin [Kibdelosporangium persicum]
MDKTVPRLTRPYDPDELDAAVRERGAVVLSGAYTTEQCDTFLTEVGKHLAEHPEEADYAASSVLGGFQGDTTATLHGLVGTIPCAPEMVLQRDIVDCARRVLSPLSDTILLTIAEYMARKPGAFRQELHLDTFSWRHVPPSPNPIALTVMAAMSDFTAGNGATWVVLDSHSGSPMAPAPDWSEAVQAEMSKGDALLFRADLFHAGGANTTESDVRHIFSMGFQVAWLRQVENSSLSVPPAKAAQLPPELQELLGYSHELVLGLYKGGHPRNALTTA